MKYIRAKNDKIYETKYLIKCEDYRYADGWFTKNGVPLIATKESDNIEDLFDETVASHKDGSKFHWGRHPIKEIISFYRVNENKFYRVNENKVTELDCLGGYIWDIGGNLIKVAELTNEGWKLV